MFIYFDRGFARVVCGFVIFAILMHCIFAIFLFCIYCSSPYTILRICSLCDWIVDTLSLASSAARGTSISWKWHVQSGFSLDISSLHLVAYLDSGTTVSFEGQNLSYGFTEVDTVRCVLALRSAFLPAQLCAEAAAFFTWRKIAFSW